MLSGFGVVVNSLGKRIKPYLPQICGIIKVTCTHVHMHTRTCAHTHSTRESKALRKKSPANHGIMFRMKTMRASSVVFSFLHTPACTPLKTTSLGPPGDPQWRLLFRHLFFHPPPSPETPHRSGASTTKPRACVNKPPIWCRALRWSCARAKRRS